ncbi:MAG: hypothetical protein K2W82_03615 [Candidatus Obscuribacterales bacterium]|nr:hypothetical protein [Candidatus Obscuribacterales bacterium]
MRYLVPAILGLAIIQFQSAQAQNNSTNTANPNVRTYGNRPAGMLPYQNQPGFGYYAPQVVPPLSLLRGGAYWRSPSGYYYPWGASYGYMPVAPPVVVVQQGTTTAPAQPTVYEMIKDMSAFLEEQNKKGKFKPDDYAHLNRRLNDLRVKQSMLASRNGGTLDSVDEENFRKDLTMLSGDISRRVKP